MKARLAAALLAGGVASGAAAQGAAAPDVFTRADKGHCIACHQLPEGVAPATRSDLGPRLEGARMRQLGRAGLRAAIDDPTRANPDTVMPPFGKHQLLEPAEIQRIVDFLHALP